MISDINKNKDELREYLILYQRLDAVYHDFALLAGVSDSVVGIFYIIDLLGSGLRQSDLYSLAGMSRQTVNSALKKMSADGLITVKKGEGRGTNVFLTAKGRASMKRVVEPLRTAENRVFNSLTPRERREVTRLINILAGGMKESLEDARAAQKKKRASKKESI